MKILPFALTRQACHARAKLGPELKARVDRLITALRLVPTSGLYDNATQQFKANLGSALSVDYMLVSDPEPRLVVLNIRAFRLGPLPERFVRHRKAELAG